MARHSEFTLSAWTVVKVNGLPFCLAESVSVFSCAENYMLLFSQEEHSVGIPIQAEAPVFRS